MRKEDLLNKKVREIEVQILDKHHEKQPLLDRGELEAVSHLLKVYGDLIRSFFSPDLLQRPTDSWLTEVNRWTCALYQGLCWIFENCKMQKEFSGDIWTKIDDEAFSLLSWARSYNKLCNDYIAASRGIYLASCDEDKHEIRFQFKNDNICTMLTCQLASWPVHTFASLKEMPEAELQRIFCSWLAKIDLTKLRNHEGLANFEFDTDSADFQSVITWARRVILPELDGTQDLAGFSLEQFRVFWGNLTVECQLMTRLEEHVDKVIGPENGLGSMMYQLPEEELASYFSTNYCLDRNVISAIIECLTFDAKSTKSNSMNSPFVKTRCGIISMLSRRIVTCDPNLLLCSSLAKRSRKRIYETVINKIEQVNVVQIAESLQNAGFKLLVQKRLENASGECICPDIILHEPETERVLILDYKHAIPPIGAGEVNNRLRDLEIWTQQIRKYLEFASNNQDLLASVLSLNHISCIDGMLLFRWPIAIPGIIEDDVTFGDWPSLAVGLKCPESIGIKEIINFYRMPRDSDQKLRLWHVDEECIKVGKWTYKRPIIVSQRDKS